MQSKLTTSITRFGELILLFCAAFMAAFSPISLIPTHADSETQLKESSPVCSLSACSYPLKQHSIIRAKSLATIGFLNIIPLFSPNGYALVSSSPFDRVDLSYSFLRLSILSSQAHPPTLI